jgi:hypothetical protein
MNILYIIVWSIYTSLLIVGHILDISPSFFQGCMYGIATVGFIEALIDMHEDE